MVGSYLELHTCEIDSLGDLESVGGHLDIRRTNIKSFGNLKWIGGSLFMGNTPLSKKYSEEQIRQMINIEGEILL